MTAKTKINHAKNKIKKKKYFILFLKKARYYYEHSYLQIVQCESKDAGETGAT